MLARCGCTQNRRPHCPQRPHAINQWLGTGDSKVVYLISDIEYRVIIP